MLPPITLVLGASSRPGRISAEAVARLRQAGHQVLAIGRTEGQVAGVWIRPELPDPLPGPVATVTLYLSPENQAPYEQAILKMAPKRVIFNPGTENPAFARRLESAGIQAIWGCTLVMLASGLYDSDYL